MPLFIIDIVNYVSKVALKLDYVSERDPSP